MSTTSRILWWLIIFSLAILLDLIILQLWKVYRKLLANAKTQGAKINHLALITYAVKIGFNNLLKRCTKGRKMAVTQQPPTSTGPQGEKMVRLQRGYLPFASAIQLVLAALAIYAGQYLMVQIPKSREWGLAILIAGILLAYFRLKPTQARGWLDWFQVGLGFLICFPITLNVDNWTVEIHPSILIILWLLCILLVATPALKLSPKKIGSAWPNSGHFTRSDWLLLGILLLSALIFRITALESIPAPIDPDEASLGLFFKDVVEGRYRQPFGTGWATHPALQFFLIVPLNYLTKRPIFLMRLPSVLYGTLAVGAGYLAARAGWGRRVALVTGVLLVSSDVGIHFSRLGVNNISDSLFASATIAALWSAASTGNPVAYVLAGAGMGLAQYYYFGNRAIPFVVIASLVFWAILNRSQVRRAWRLLLFSLLVFLIVAGPLLGFWIRNPESLDRVVRVATFFTKTWENMAEQTGQPISVLRWGHVRDSLLTFTVLADQGSFYNSGRAMLPPLLAPFFIIGILVLITRWKKPASLSTLAWILVFLLLGSILINTAATFQRLLGMYPAVILATAIGLDYSASTICQRLSLKRLTPGRITYIVAAFAAVSSVYFYFNTFNNQQVWKPPDYDAVAIMAREHTQLKGNGTFIMETLLGIGEDGTIYLPLIKLIDDGGFRGNASQISDNMDDKPFRFYFFYDKFDELPNIQALYPGGEIRKYRRPADGELVLIRYSVP
jgi:hypothetical protein